MNKEEKIIILGDELYEQFIEGKQTIDTHELLNLFAKRINNLQSKINKAIEYINKEYDTEPHELYGLVSADELLNILNDDKIQEIPQLKGTMEQLDDLCDIRKEEK